VNRARHVIRIVGALLLGVAVAGAPALTYAQHGSGGGGGGGGGHSSGGGGGGHVGGGGGHYMGGGGHFYGGGYGGGHAFATPRYGAYGGGHYFAAGRVGATGHYVYPGHGPGVYPGHLPGVHPGAGFAPGTAYWHGGHAWVGGYWHGYYWPHVWFYPGYSWFLPVLPLGYATFWWGGVPYYYWNNLYYTWSPASSGYVVTDPPPTGGDNTPIDPNAAYDQGQGQGGGYEQTQPPAAAPSDAPPAGPAPAPYNGQAPYGQAPSGAAAGDVYLYPRNGQSEAQQQNDRYECHSWAVNQTGFDPTRGGMQSGNDTEYRRAMVACLDARGYSAR